MVIILPILCVSGCKTTTSPINPPLPPIPNASVLAELDAHDMTPQSAPHTWEFLGKSFMYYDIIMQMHNYANMQ